MIFNKFKFDYLYMKNLPINQYYSILQSYGYKLGHPLVYENESIIQSIKESNTISGTEIAPGTEMAFHHIRPNYILLFCTRSNKTHKTILIKSIDIIKELSKKDINLLYRPSFRIDPPLSYKHKYNSQWKSIINYNKELCIVINPNCTTQFLNRQASYSYCNLLNICNKNKNKNTIVLEKGDLLIINNNSILSGTITGHDPSRLVHKMYII